MNLDYLLSEIERCKASIHALVDEVSKLQKRVKALEEHHIHHQDVRQAGSTGEPIFILNNKTESSK